MLEQDEESESAQYESLATTEMGGDTGDAPADSSVEVVDDGWSDQSVGPAENPWSPGEDDRQQEFADAGGGTLRDHLLWQIELVRSTRASCPSRAQSSTHQRRWLDRPARDRATLRPETTPAEVEQCWRCRRSTPGAGAFASECSA
jgi:hypothetical protein